jgi:uncharacterized membrane protein HdeD (DUF308 family)
LSSPVCWPSSFLAGVLTLTLVLAAYLVVEGIIEMAVFFRLRSLPGAVWFFVDGVVSLLIAALIVAHWPSSSVWALGTLVGISLIFSGMARLMNPVSSSRVLPMSGRHDIDRHDAAA